MAVLLKHFKLTMDLTKKDIHVLIESCRRNHMSPSETHDFISTAWGDVLSLRRVQEIQKEFSEGARTAFDRKKSPSRKSQERLHLIPIIGEEVWNDPHISCRKLSIIHEVSHQMIFKILTEDLLLKSVSDRFVPHTLSQENKDQRVHCAREFIRASRTRNIKQRMVHTDEKWFYSRPIGCPSTRTSWVTPGGDVPTTARRKFMEKKFMVMVALNFDGLSFFKILENGETVDSAKYTSFLDEAFNTFSTYELRQAQKAIFFENCVLQHDNARPHVSHTTQTHLAAKNCSLLPQAPYSPDTNLLDRFLFPKLEMERCELQFENREDLRNFLTNAIRRLTTEMMNKQWDKLLSHAQAIITQGGDYI